MTDTDKKEMALRGFGALYRLNGGAEEPAWLAACIGQRIDALYIEDKGLILELANGESLHLFDDGQSCCESRYASTDDDLSYHVGTQLLGAEVLSGGQNGDDYDVHEIMFLHVTTSNGVFVVQTHNIHNGYYGGFDLRVSARPRVMA